MLIYCLILIHEKQILTHYSHLPAYEDETDRVFRNVGI